MIGLFFCVLFRKLDEKGLLYVQLLLLFTILREHFQWWQLAPALKKSLGNRWRRRSLGEKQGNIPALELTEQSGHKLLSQDRVSSTRYLKPRLLLHVQDQLGTLYLLLLHTTYSEKKFSMYYRMDTNTTALLIRAACGNFLNKVHFLRQIFDYNGQNWLKFECNDTKKPERKLKQRRSICVDTVYC